MLRFRALTASGSSCQSVFAFDRIAFAVPHHEMLPDARHGGQQTLRVLVRLVEDLFHGPCSTTWPRYMTTTSSAMSAITPMLW